MKWLDQKVSLSKKLEKKYKASNKLIRQLNKHQDEILQLLNDLKNIEGIIHPERPFEVNNVKINENLQLNEAISIFPNIRRLNPLSSIISTIGPTQDSSSAQITSSYYKSQIS